MKAGVQKKNLNINAYLSLSLCNITFVFVSTSNLNKNKSNAITYFSIVFEKSVIKLCQTTTDIKSSTNIWWVQIFILAN